MPEGLTVLEDVDGDLVIDSSMNLDVINGIDGAKVIVGENMEILICNIKRPSLTFRAMQFMK